MTRLCVTAGWTQSGCLQWVRLKKKGEEERAADGGDPLLESIARASLPAQLGEKVEKGGKIRLAMRVGGGAFALQRQRSVVATAFPHFFHLQFRYHFFLHLRFRFRCPI